jgi:hypothetical protein
VDLAVRLTHNVQQQQTRPPVRRGHDCGCIVGKPSIIRSPSSKLELDADPVIDRGSNPLLAAEVTFGRLHRNVPQEKLDLL